MSVDVALLVIGPFGPVLNAGQLSASPGELAALEECDGDIS
jgi:hypothetical protein